MSTQLTLQCRDLEPQFAMPKGFALVLALIVVIGLVVADTRQARFAADPAPARVTGSFTGSYDKGLPMYRLPAVEIRATRPSTRIAANAAGQMPAVRQPQ